LRRSGAVDFGDERLIGSAARPKTSWFMRIGALLGMLAFGVATSATAGTARADEPEPSLTSMVDQAWTWSAELPEASRWFSRVLPTVDELFDPTGWSTRCLVGLRDAAAGSLDYSRELLAMVPAPAVPDLTILSASPVPGVESSGFGWRRDPINRRRDKLHKGADFSADRGTPVYAAGAGVVAFTGRQSGYGKVIYIDHGGGVVTRYAHLSRIEIAVGAAVPAASLIGRVGATGRATGPHLHFEVRLEGRAVDPELAMRVAALQRTDPATARWTAWLLSPTAQAERTDRHDPPRRLSNKQRRPERRHAPARDRNRS